MSEHRVRYATESDFDDVMAFGDVYMGIDYLRHRYHSFIRDSSVRSYVYIVGEEVVGFCSAFLVDGGMTLLIRASRVKAGYQGQGVYGKLTRHVYEEYKKIPSVKLEAFTTNNLNFTTNEDSIMKKFSMISKKGFLNYRFKMDDIHFPDIPKKSYIQEVTSEDMTLIIGNKDIHPDLFPGGKMIIDWVPLRLLTSNMKYIMNSEIVAAFQTHDSSTPLLSLGTGLPCELGLRYVVDIYGSDVTSLQLHILSHLHRVKSQTNEEVVLQIVCDQRIEKAADEIVRAFGISDFGFKMTYMVNLERDFK